MKLADGVFVTTMEGGTTGLNPGALVDGPIVNFGIFVGSSCFFGFNGGAGYDVADDGNLMVGTWESGEVVDVFVGVT